MRLPVQWLHDYCRPELTAAELAERFDLTGSELGAVYHHGVAGVERFVVGRVIEAVPHPDADRLRVCRVDVGDGDPAQIVCGAPNVAAGQTVAVGRPGGVMPDGTELRAATLRGVESQGMILAEDELAIGTDHAGIIVLADDGLAPGRPLAEVLPIATQVIELEITPNRPDCLGVYGLAREAHAATGAPLAPPPWEGHEIDGDSAGGVEVEVQTARCLRFTARLFEDVRVGPSPAWLKARLMAAGQRPIANVVDVTNYVMLLTGQPLHAFDFDRVAGGWLVVRDAHEGERVETLDGEVRELDSEMVVIEDADGPTSIAGIMGGARSEVGAGTTRVLMEAATWNGPSIRRSSTRLGLRSEASTRFEKQLQPEQALEAQAVAAQLMVEVCGARAVGGTVDVGGPGPPPLELHLRERRVAELLGAEIPAARCAEILESLGFPATEVGGGVDVAVPHWRRGDVTREVDLIEEVARIDGMERLPATLPSRQDAGGRLTPAQRARRRVEDTLAGSGLLEVQGWSFQSPSVARRLRLDDAQYPPVRLENPLSEEQSVMRTLLLGSLLDAAAYNASHGAADLRLFELGAVYRARQRGQLPDERRHVAALLCGPARPPSWRDATPPRADVFAIKGIAEGLLTTLRVDWEVAAPIELSFLHPGRAGEIRVGGEGVGWFGELHPLVARGWDLDDGAAFELDLDRVAERAGEVLAVYRDVTSFPVVRQDVAVVVDEALPAADVVEVVRRTGGELLSSVQVFDVYRGEQVGAGRVSLALALEFRAGDRTLTDEEVAGVRQAIAAALSQELGGELRA